jgi:hypothetical protein
MKRLVIAILICLAAGSAQAQEVYNSSGRIKPRKQMKKTGFDRDKLILGGDIRLNLGTYLNVGIAPILGYRFTDHFSAGVKIGYTFKREEIDPSYLPLGVSNVFTQNVYTASIWARYFVWQNIFVQLEPEINSYDYYEGDPNTGQYIKKSVAGPSLLLGVGFKQPISDRTSFVATIVYDALQDKYSIYGNQIDVRFGVLVGF